MNNALAMDRFGDAVRRSKIPRDALTRFMNSGYVPQERQMFFHAAARACDKRGGPVDIGFGGARGPGKSHAAFAQLTLDDCQRQPDLKCLFLRKVGKASRESAEDLRRKILRNVPHVYKTQAGVIVFPNGSRVILGHFQTEKDIEGYLGLEYDVICIEEDTQLTARKKSDIETCLRTSKPNWRPRMYRTTNPGGVDHRGFKEKFVKPYMRGKEKETRFIPATVYDNRFTNREYRKTLERLTGWRRKAWLEGSWDIDAGQFFSNFSEDLIKVPHINFAQVPSHWPMWISFDYGYTHPSAWYWYTEFDGSIIVLDEHVEAQRSSEYHSNVIKTRTLSYGRTMDGIDAIVAGGDVFAQKGDKHSLTIADQYEGYGIVLERAAMDRITGWSELLRRFGDTEHNIQPSIKITDRCTRLLDLLPTLQHDPNRPEDVLKVDADPETGLSGDDEADSLRYGVMYRYTSRRPQDRDSALGKAIEASPY